MKTAESVRIPVATYRLQLSKDFTLREANHLSSYLKRLGISDVYVSPLLQAKKDSTHCYDAVNHGQINSQIGGLAGLELLSTRLKHNKMGILLDIVPNHMSTDEDNKLWQNVLEFGPTSKYASFFDVYWSDAAKDKVPKIVMPILGDEYARVLRSSQLNLVFDEKEMRPKIELYGSQRLPLAPRSYALLLKDIEKRANTIHIPK